MPLTPQDIVRKEFREALRGYNQADVDLFLDEVVEEFTRLTEENQKLRVRLAALQQEIARYREARGGTGPIVASADPERVEMEVRARMRRFLEEQLRALDAAAPASPTVERITREVPLPPAQPRPTGARTRRDTEPTVIREPEPAPRDLEPPASAGTHEPFWAGE